MHLDRQQNSTNHPAPFRLVSSTDHVSAVTGATVAVQVSKDGGGSWASASGTVTEVGNGAYWFNGNATDRNTLGGLLFRCTATGADDYIGTLTIVPWDPWGVLPSISAGFGCGFPAIDAQYSVTLSRDQYQNFAKVAFGGQYHNVWFVDPANGNDTFTGLTPISAVSDGPFATFNKAITSASSGDLILLSAGTHTPSGACKVPDGVSVRGQGIDVTFIDGHTLSIAGNGCIVRPGGSARFSDCTILGDSTVGNFTAPIGYDCGSQSPPQNCLVERVKTVGWSDGIYIKAKSGDTCSIRFRDCIFASGYDTLNAIPNSASDIGTINLELENCQFLGSGPVGRTDPVRCVCHEANGLIRMWGGKIDATHAGTGGVYGVITVAQSGNTNSPVIRCYGVEIYTSGGASHNDFANGIGTITETDCTYDPTTVSGTVTQRQPLAGLDFTNVRQATGPTTLTNITVPAVTTVGSVTGNVGGSVASVTGAVGSVTGNVGGNVVGSVGSVTGAVGSVTAPVTTTYAIKKNTALSNFVFVMYDGTDHLTPKTGLTVTGQVSIDGAAYTNLTNSVAELSNGVYKVNLAAADLNGNVIGLKFTATGADITFITIPTQS